jgi:lipoprotein NlpD
VSRYLVLVLSMVLLLGACTHARVVQREPGAQRPPRAAPPRPAISPLPRDGVHVVSRGETLYGISFRYGLRFQDVAAWNGISDPYLIEVGQRLRLKSGRSGSVAAATATPSAPRPGTRPVAPATRPHSAPVAPAAALPPRPLPPPPTASPVVAGNGVVGWQWPTSGDVVGRFVAGDQTRQGIDIAGRAGQDVRAAGGGVVVYSGAGLVGYGELIIIKHSEEWLSAYAHNQARLVAEGSRVQAGQVIARMGRTGAARDMLHFEIRRNGKPVDPQALLPPP